MKMSQFILNPLLLLLLCVPICWSMSTNEALVAPITRDSATLQHVIEVEQKTPLEKTRLVLDLAEDLVWVHCNASVYKSSTYTPVIRRSAFCSVLVSLSKGNRHGPCFGPAGPGCQNDTCYVEIANNAGQPVQTIGDLSEDVLALPSTDGKNEGPKATAPQYAFACAPDGQFLEGLAKGVAGVAGLSRGYLALPNQLSYTFDFSYRFAMCLPAGNSPGALFFGEEPYVFGAGTEFSFYKNLTYTSLLQNPVYPNDYFIGMRSIAVNGKKIAIDSAHLKIDENGHNGTRLSTLAPYTQLLTPIYNALRDAFLKQAEAMNMSRLPSPVKHFDACFDAHTVKSTTLGPAVPTIDLVLRTFGKSVWRIWGANSMVHVSPRVLCLAFVDAGAFPRSSIVIGSHQMQDNLLQFNLMTSQLGFTSSLLAYHTSCSNFNFTSTDRQA